MLTPQLRRLAIACAVAAWPATVSAKPECTQLVYSVNDYGKEGPTRDAQDLLDKYIVRWTQDKGIKTYKTGKKDVTCELFLNAIVFDEYTCTATADVCWTPGKGAPKGEPKTAPNSTVKGEPKSAPNSTAKSEPKSALKSTTTH